MSDLLRDQRPDAITRGLFLVGSVAYLLGSGSQLVATFAEIRWLLVPAIVLWIAGVVVVLVAAGRYISGRSEHGPLSATESEPAVHRERDAYARELSALLDRWDFLGVNDPPEDGPGPGEYDDLIQPIIGWLGEGVDSAGLSRRLHVLLMSDYGVAPTVPDLEAELTASLVEWWAQRR